MRGDEIYEPVGGFDFSDDLGEETMMAFLNDFDPLLGMAPPAKRCRCFCSDLFEKPNTLSLNASGLPVAISSSWRVVLLM